jgi:FecR protein
MHSHRWTLASVLTVLFAMQSTVSNAESRIGTAASTRPNVEAVAGGNTQKLSAGSEIYANQTIRTGNRGMADLVFLDSTNLNVGPRSEVRLDKFVYDPTGSAGSVVLHATRGTFRFVTGTQAKRAYQVGTPHGTLGASLSVARKGGAGLRPLLCQAPAGPPTGAAPPGRGEVELLVNKPGEDCVTKFRLVAGQVEWRGKTGQVARLTDPNRNNVACIDASGNVTLSTSALSLLISAEAPPSPPGVPAGTFPITPVIPQVMSPTQLPL